MLLAGCGEVPQQTGAAPESTAVAKSDALELADILAPQSGSQSERRLQDFEQKSINNVTRQINSCLDKAGEDVESGQKCSSPEALASYVDPEMARYRELLGTVSAEVRAVEANDPRVQKWIDCVRGLGVQGADLTEIDAAVSTGVMDGKLDTAQVQECAVSSFGSADAALESHREAVNSLNQSKAAVELVGLASKMGL